jgi:hypothetical protein
MQCHGYQQKYFYGLCSGPPRLWCGRSKRNAVNSQKSPEFKDILGDEFNLAWKALKKHALFAEDNELAELFMSLSGTLIARKNGQPIIWHL